MKKNKEINNFKENIQNIDNSIIELLNKRAQLIKENVELFQDTQFGMEDRILQRYKDLSTGPFPNEALFSIFQEIISACHSLARPLCIAYFGLPASFTHIATMKKFGSFEKLVPVASIEDVFGEVERGFCDFGVVPVENSTEGMVSHTLDMFVDSDLKICNEIMIVIHHNLLSKSSNINDIKKIFSHPQPVAQSRAWLRSHVPNIPIIEAESTSKAAELASKDKSIAAIASVEAAKLYGLNILQARIEDRANNYTRFLVIGKEQIPRSGNDKTSLIFSIKDRIGALYHMLAPFATHSINLTKIESRPTKKKPWEYIFFLDIQGHIQDNEVRDALLELKEMCIFLKVLGSYPAHRNGK
ncbi:MAG: prephenate dehydratase [bacterium]